MNRLNKKYGRNYTVKEVADFFRIDESTARRKCKKIKGSFKYGNRRLVPEEAFDNYLNNIGVKKKKEPVNKQWVNKTLDEILEKHNVKRTN